MYPAAHYQAITSDGRITMGSGTGLSLWSPEETTPIPIQGDHLGGAIINDQGGWIIYASFSPPVLRSIELASGTDTLIAEGAGFDFYQQSISNDGSLVLYVAPPATSNAKGDPNAEPGLRQAFLIKPDGTERRQLTDAPEGVSEAILSGAGNVVYVATRHGRLLRIDVATGTTEELIACVPFITSIEGGAAPGSLGFIRGTGLSDTIAVADAPLPESLGGVEVTLGDTPARILLVAPHDVRFQIPFEIETGDLPVRISSPQSPFEQEPFLLPIRAQMPRFIRNGSEVEVPGLSDSQAVSVNLDFSALITPDYPAGPNDIVTLYMTGLGVTEPRVATGEFTPIGPLSLPTTPTKCVWQRGREQLPIETFFAGLAPGLIGVYQVTVRLPPDPLPFMTDPSRTVVSLRCGVLGAQTDNAGVFVRLDSQIK